MKAFELKVKDETLLLKWDMWAMQRFCELSGLSLIGLLTLYDMNTLTLKQIMQMVQAAFESANEGREVTERQVAAWIDEAGGIVKEGSAVLDFIKYMIKQSSTDTTEVQTDEEKKSQ